MLEKLEQQDEVVSDFLYAHARAVLMKPPVEDDPYTEELPPVRLNYPWWYVRRTWLEHRDKGIYPYPGGYNQQPKALMDDWDEVNVRYMRAYDDLKRGGTETLNDLIYGKDDDDSVSMAQRR